MDKGWQRIGSTISQLLSDGVADAGAVANAMLLVEFGEGRYPPPTEVGPGYWPTVNFSWDIEPDPIAIEVFADSFEFYRFFDGGTEIREMKHASSDALPRELVEILDPILRQTLPGRRSAG